MDTNSARKNDTQGWEEMSRNHIQPGDGNTINQIMRRQTGVNIQATGGDKQDRSGHGFKTLNKGHTS